MKKRIIEILKIIVMLVIPFVGITKFYNSIYYRAYYLFFIFLFVVMYFGYKYIKEKK